MTRKLCSAGVRGPYSYVILDTESGIVSKILNNDNEIVVSHLNMDVAEKWTERKLDILIAKEHYEAD